MRNSTTFNLVKTLAFRIPMRGYEELTPYLRAIQDDVPNPHEGL